MINCYLDVIFDKFIAKEKIEKIITIFNKELVIGHLILDKKSNRILLRYSLPLRGAGGATPEQIEDILDIILEQCEQAYPAFHVLSNEDENKIDPLNLYFTDVIGKA